MIKKIGIILAFVLIVAVGARAQQHTTQSEIVMTKSELARFLEKIALAKKEKMQKDQRIFDQEELARLRLGYHENRNPTRYSDYNRNGLEQEIQRLNARIDYLMSARSGNGSNSTTVVTPQGNGYGEYYSPYQNPSLQPQTTVLEPSDNLKQELNAVQKQLDDLLKEKDAASNSDEIATLNHQIEALQQQLLASRNLSEKDKEALKRYGDTQLQVFFANNAADVAAQYRDEVKRAATIAKENPQLTIVLKGFASTVGNSRYNYELSMRRNESVKRMLIDYGVFPDQIASIFYGEDASTSESVARRVDMNFILK